MRNTADKVRYRAVTCGRSGERGLKRPGPGGAQIETTDGIYGVVT